MEEDGPVYANEATWGLDRINQRSLPLDGMFQSSGKFCNKLINRLIVKTVSALSYTGLYTHSVNQCHQSRDFVAHLGYF